MVSTANELSAIVGSQHTVEFDNVRYVFIREKDKVVVIAHNASTPQADVLIKIKYPTDA